MHSNGDHDTASMTSAAAFIGLLLLGAGPIAVVFCVALARKSFLVLVTLGRWVHHEGGAATFRVPWPPPPNSRHLALAHRRLLPPPPVQRLLLAVHALPDIGDIQG